jgi:hypothetical protein
MRIPGSLSLTSRTRSVLAQFASLSVDGKIVMRDKAHMTASFPLSLAPLFKPLFEDKGSP